MDAFQDFEQADTGILVATSALGMEYMQHALNVSLYQLLYSYLSLYHCSVRSKLHRHKADNYLRDSRKP